MRMNEVLEAEREQLQRELNQRLADCGSTHATSVAELEQVQADLSARLTSSEVRASNLENERNAVIQKLNATVSHCHRHQLIANRIGCLRIFMLLLNNAPYAFLPCVSLKLCSHIIIKRFLRGAYYETRHWSASLFDYSN